MTDVFNHFEVQPNLSVFKYSISNARQYHYGVIDVGSGVKGFGGAEKPELAQTKAIFEMIERSVFRSKSISSDKSSSGWAAHEKLEQAKLNAGFELIERDAVLCSWLLKKAPKIVANTHFEMFGSDFNVLQFGSGCGFFVLGAVLEEKSKGARMLLTTTGSTIAEGISKLITDSERAAYLLFDENCILNSEFSQIHLDFCALSGNEISWLFENGEGLKYDQIEFDYDVFETPLWNRSNAWVVKARSRVLQPLYYHGRILRNINRYRIRSLSGYPFKLNRNRHPIL